MRPEHWVYTIPLRVRSLFRRAQADLELDDELRDHVERKSEEYVAKGLSLKEARRRALLEMGGIEKRKEECRDTRRVVWLQDLVQDLYFGLRMLRKSPGFTTVAVLTLALGIGANTALFSVANELFLRPLPVRNAGRLVVLAVREKGSAEVRDISYPDFLDYRADEQAFSAIAAYNLGLDGLSTGRWAKRAVTCYVTGNYFPMLGLQPALGRLIQRGEGASPGADPVVVLSYSFWQRQFARDPDVLGKIIRVNGRPETVIGVAPGGFHGTKAWVETDAYLPISQMAQEGNGFWTARGWRGDGGFTVLARLKAGVSIGQAQASLNVIAQKLAQMYPQTDRDISVEVYPEPLARPQADAAEEAPPIVTAFMFLGLIVLVLACVNLANMLESRAISREGEMAVRSALGAGRGRLARQCITESILLAMLGGAAGLALAELISKPLSSICTPVDLTLFKPDFQPDWRVFAYASAIALLAGVVMGLVPARRAWRTNLNQVMHEVGRALAGSRRHHRARSVLVITQVAASTILLIAAGLFVRSLGAVEHMNLGFDPHHILNVGVDVGELGYKEAQGERFFQELLNRVRGLAGVESAGYVYSTPFYHNRLGSFVWIQGRSLLSGQRPPSIFYNAVSPSIFETLHIPLLRGRGFSAADDASSSKVAIVNEGMALRFWPGRDPIGEQFSLAGPAGPWIRIVGVVDDAQFVSPMVPRTDPYFFLPLAQDYLPALALQVRTSLPPTLLARAIERQIQALAPGLPIFDLRTQEQALNGATGFFLFRLGADVAAGLGILGLLLAVVGVYGVASYAASLRTHEIGIRVALGAQEADVLWRVMGQGIIPALLGLVVGVTVSLGLVRFLSSLLYGVKPTDPVTFGAVSLILTAVTLLACYVPARRAMRVDPMVALRHE